MSSSSSESSNSPALARKRKQDVVESSEPDSDGGRDDTSAASSADEEDSGSDAPRLVPPTGDTVLSHAERRRQKKKEKRAQLTAASEPQSARKKRKLDDCTASDVPAETKAKTANAIKTKTKTKALSTKDDPRRQKRQNSVWVGNLSFRTTQEDLQGFFDGVGAITRVHMPMRRGKQVQGENMGFAYVDFGTPEAKVIAITLSEGQLDGRKLLIKDGDDFTGRPVKANTEPASAEGGGKDATTASGKGLSKTAQKILRVQKQPPAPTLFLGNLGFETKEESIRELFETHRFGGHSDKGKGKGVDVKAEGEDGDGDGDAPKSKDVWIRKIRMGTFEDSGVCKGFAFIDFTSIEHATDALVNPRNHRLNGRDLVVEYASPDAVRRGGGPRHSKGDRDRTEKSGSGSGRTWQKGSANTSYTKERRPRKAEQAGNADVEEIPEEGTTTPRSDSRRTDSTHHDRSHTRRTKPGAALAQAQRQSAAILPGRGQKIVF